VGKRLWQAGWHLQVSAGKEVSGDCGTSSSNYFKFLSTSAVSFPLSSSHIAAMFVSSEVTF